MPGNVRKEEMVPTLSTQMFRLEILELSLTWKFSVWANKISNQNLLNCGTNDEQPM